MDNLAIATIKTILIGLVALGVLLFLPAWTLNYWQAWVFIVVILASGNALGLYLALKDPVLLERRMKIGPTEERSPVQRIIMVLAIGASLALLVFSALDHRFGWSTVPPFVSLIGDALVALSFYLYYIVFKENSYGASTIQVYEGQHVISTGPYALIRHPMYASVLVMAVGIPLALGSWWGLAFLVLTIPILMVRILNEEQFLAHDLPGYSEYEHRVRYRLVPYLW